MTKWLSVAELSKQAQIPESTARRYLSRYENFFRYDEKQRGRKYHPNSIAVVVFIQNCYSESIEAEDIEDALSKQFPINISTTESPETTTQPPTPILATKEDIDTVLTEIRTIREENKQLHEYIDQRLEDRDKKLMETLRIMGEARKQLAAAKDEPESKKRPWWKFGK